jgi:hypothetical protein
MSDREELADALYLLRAGSNPDTFLRTLRTYVLQHIETTEQMAALLRDLSSVNPPAFVDALNTLEGAPLPSDANQRWSIKSVHKALPRTPAKAKPKRRAAKEPARRQDSKSRRARNSIT